MGNIFTVKELASGDSVLEVAYGRVSIKENRLAITMDSGAFNKQANALKLNKVYQISVIQNDAEVLSSMAVFESYHYSMSNLAGLQDGYAVGDNTILFKLMD